MAQRIIPKGFTLSAVHAGLKKNDYDLALIASEPPANAAAVYTTNRVIAAPLLLCKERDKNKIRAVVINSKNANALTAEKGVQNAKRMTEAVAKELKCDAKHVLVASTGVIGEQLPIEKIERAIPKAVELLAPSENNAPYAILTTDRFSKKRGRKLSINGKRIALYGMAKGAGMIHPKLATMLAFIITDAAFSKEAQKKLLKETVDTTFNRISVDGDTSTNDMVLFLANGAADNTPITYNSRAYHAFKKEFQDLCERLAALMVKDGEGTTKVIRLEVTGAKSKTQAQRVAEAIATSSLVKTAFYGEDANWGRIVAAAGYADKNFNPDTATLRLNGTTVFHNGTVKKYSEQKINRSMKHKTQHVILDLGFTQDARATYYFSDLTHDYVSLNSNYRS